jgi:NADPH-dependent glutamate synthase beta subunit-like oxidoreductase/NAD-dependent dihydropyrimidine dehydrogenase PreA subunit
MKREKERLQRVLVIGATPAGIAAVNKLGELGIPVTLVDRDRDLDARLAADVWRLPSGTPLNHAHRPGLLRILRNPGIKSLLPARVASIKHSHQGFRVDIQTDPTFVDADLCILCGRCVKACPVTCDDVKAIGIAGRQSLPGRAFIDKRRLPLCREACPLGVNAQGYVALAAAGRFAEALELVRQRNVLPGICGRICTHPCEAACRRGELDQPVAIRDIKRFLADYEMRQGAAAEAAPKAQSASERGEKIAVIGSGPAGLAAAAELARQGCRVTVYEKEKQAGGLLRYGIGPHRLPREILDLELAWIEHLGVKFVTGRNIDLKKDLPGLTKEHNAVLLTVGTWADRRLGVPGEDLTGVEGCLAFLPRLYRGEIKRLKEKIAVIGDGNAAFDLARALIRVGAEVTIVSWFDAGSIPADPGEYADALAEGIKLHAGARVTAFEGEKGRLRKLVCRPTQPGPADDRGICWPVVVKDSDSYTLAFDRAVVAIGQTGPWTADNTGGLKISAGGLIEVDERRGAGLKNVFATGDAVTGYSSVVQAMADGRAAAVRILEQVCDLIIDDPAAWRPVDRDFPPVPEGQPARPRTPMPERDISDREGNFREVALGFSETQIKVEAERCLQCGVCSECMECVVACGPVGAIRHDETAERIHEQVGAVIIADPEQAPPARGDDIIRAYGPNTSRADVPAMMTRGYAAAARAITILGDTSRQRRGKGVAFTPPDPGLSKTIRIGVFFCTCNQSLGWLPEFDEYARSLTNQPDIVHVETITAACVPDGISHILRSVREKGITRLVLTSCVCCPLDFVCSACTDQRSRLKKALFNATGISRSMVTTFNLRGEVLNLIASSPETAVRRFEGMTDRAIRRSRHLKPFSSPARNYNFTTAIIGESEAAVESARVLAQSGVDVFMFGTRDQPLSDRLEDVDVLRFEGSRALRISGSLGDFHIQVLLGDQEQEFQAGAVILGEKDLEAVAFLRQNELPGRGFSASMQRPGVTGIPFYYPGMTSVAGLFVADPPGIEVSARQKGAAAAILAAAVMPRGPRQSKGYNVSIDADRCRICGRCIQACPYQAIVIRQNEYGNWHAVVDETLCKGCGNCISVCPSNAADSPYRDQQFLEQTLEEILLK